MMELGISLAEAEPFIKEEQEMTCEYEQNDDLDPLDLDVKKETVMKHEIKMESETKVTDETNEVTSSANEKSDVANNKHIVNRNDFSNKVSSSNDIVLESGSINGSVLPTGLLLYRLFNQIIIDALLGSPADNLRKELPLWNNSEINVMTSTQNWVNKHNFSREKFASKKSQKKSGLVIKKGKSGVISSSLDKVGNYIVLTNCGSVVDKRQNINKLSNSKNSLIKPSDCADESSISKCTICDVDHRVNGMSYRKQIKYKSNRDPDADKLDGSVTSLHRDNVDNSLKQQKEFSMIDDRIYPEEKKSSEEVDRDNGFNSALKKCNVLLNKINCRTNDKYYVCSVCKEFFTCTIDFETHKTSCRNEIGNSLEENENYLCELCGEFFTPDNESYKVHLTSHDFVNTNSSFEVLEVKSSRTIPSDSRLNSVKSQKKFRSFSCNKCDKNFSKSTLLKIHCRKFHLSSVKSFKYSCNVCKKKFTKKICLLKHKNLHHNNCKMKVGFDCLVCHESFKQVEALKLHINNHHGRVKQFSCVKCNKSFTRRSSLVSHYKMSHDGFYNDVFVKI